MAVIPRKALPARVRARGIRPRVRVLVIEISRVDEHRRYGSAEALQSPLLAAQVLRVPGHDLGDIGRGSRVGRIVLGTEKRSYDDREDQKGSVLRARRNIPGRSADSPVNLPVCTRE
jgi:hypothetical protein